jgi:hypothetical protein
MHVFADAMTVYMLSWNTREITTGSRYDKAMGDCQYYQGIKEESPLKSC